MNALSWLFDYTFNRVYLSNNDEAQQLWLKRLFSNVG